jgi:hypothetical protein
MDKLLDYFNHHMLTCSYVKYFGIECPGCGFQRSLYYLLKGDFLLSLKTFPALIPILSMLTYLVLHLIFKFENGHKVLLVLFYASTALIVINYIFKILT